MELYMINCFRIKSGEDIIATVSEDTPGASYITIKNPIQIGLTQGQTGLSLAMIPFLPFAKDKTIRIPRESILFQFEPEADLYNEYSRLHGGIILPTSPSTPKLSLME
jgi:hypothetical protein